MPIGIQSALAEKVARHEEAKYQKTIGYANRKNVWAKFDVSCRAALCGSGCDVGGHYLMGFVKITNSLSMALSDKDLRVAHLSTLRTAFEGRH